MRKLILFGAIVLASSNLGPRMVAATDAKPAKSEANYQIVPEKGEFLVLTRSVGLLSYLGKDLTIAVKEYNGKIRYDAKQPEKSTLEIHVVPTSLTVTDPLKPKDIRKIQHTMNEKVLQTDRFPEIQFKSNSVRAAQANGKKLDLRIDGDLTIAGVTQAVTIPAEIEMDGAVLKAKGQFEVKQKDFKIKPYSGLAGGIRVKNEVTIFFNLTANPS